MENEISESPEEGEIFDYSPLPRPVVQSRPDGMKFSDNSDDNDSNNSDSDNDSDSPSFRPKKPKIKNKVRRVNHGRTAQKKYNIWCSDIQESELANELVNCDVRQETLDRSRDVESYDYTLAYRLHEAGGEDSDQESNKSYRKRRYDERVNNVKEDSNEEKPRISVKQRLGRRPSDKNEEIRGHPRLMMDLRVTEDDNNEEIAIDIANKLCEPKDDLILKVVQVLGKGKAISLYRQCKDIEAAGGMLVVNGSRRRTPGGVYLMLIKGDPDVTQEMRNGIFDNDRRITAKARKKFPRKSNKPERKPSSIESSSERDLPTLLTRGELTVQQFAETKIKREETDGEKQVTNPPPSPATDGGEQIDEPREISYNDDFLDLGCDTMDIF